MNKGNCLTSVREAISNDVTVKIVKMVKMSSWCVLAWVCIYVRVKGDKKARLFKWPSVEQTDFGTSKMCTCPWPSGREFLPGQKIALKRNKKKQKLKLKSE